MDSGHETLIDSPVIVDDLGDGCETVGGAGGVGNNGQVLLVFLVVDTNDEDGYIILWWGRENNLLGTSLKMEFSLLFLQEDSSALTDVVSTSLTPLNVSWVSFTVDLNLVPVDLNTVRQLFNVSLEAA